MREMKDSGIEWLGLTSADYSIVKLKHICNMQAGKNLSSEQIAPEGEYPVYGGNGLRGYYSQYNNDGKRILVGRQGALCGNVHFAEGQFWATEHAVVTYAYPSVNLNFLYYLLVGMNLNQFVSPTAAQPGLAVSTIQNITTCVPKYEEQSRIAAYLDRRCATIDALIANQQQQIDKLKQYKQAVITETVTRGLDPNVRMKDSGVEWIGEVPENWTICRIADLYSERSESGNDSLPILTVSINSGISDRELSNDEQDRVFIRSEDKSKYKRVYPGDLAYNMMRAWQGAFGAVRVDGMISPAYIVAKPRGTAEIDNRYFEALLRTPMAIEEMHRYSRGIMDFRLRLYWPEFRNIRVCLPSIDEQRSIADYLDTQCAQIDALIALKQQKADKLAQYKKSLIYEVVTGKQEV